MDWTDKVNEQDSSCYGIYLTHSSAYTVFNFIYISYAQKKMGVVHHKQHSPNYSYLETFQGEKKNFKI
jgi:hypothetical protein